MTKEKCGCFVCKMEEVTSMYPNTIHFAPRMFVNGDNIEIASVDLISESNRTTSEGNED